MATDSGRRWLQAVGVALILSAVALEFAAVRSKRNSGPVVTERVTETGLEYQVVQASGNAIPIPVSIGLGIVAAVAGLYLLRHHEAPTELSLRAPEETPAASDRRAA